jgi:site-specific recombinase XerD
MTAKLVLDTRYKSKDNLYPICIRIRSGKQLKQCSTGYRIPEKGWNNGEVKRSIRDADIINTGIAKQLSEIRTRLTRAKNEDLHDLDSILSDKPAAPALLLSDYLFSRAQQYEDIHKVKHAKKLRLWIRNLQECLGKKDIPFNLTADDMRSLQAYLKKMGNDTNTIHKKFQLLGCLFNNAIAEGKTNAVNAFKNFKAPTKPVHKDKLTKKEIAALETLTLPDGILNDSRNLFLFSYYCKGMRFEDCIRIQKDDIINDRIVFREIRKGHGQITAKLHSKLKALIHPYIESDTPYLFPFLKKELMLDQGLQQTEESEKERLSKVEAQNVIMNRSLKVIAAAAGIKTELSAHISRHSFAQHLKEAKVHVNVIKDALGHSSVAVTERYLKALDDAAIDEDVNQIYE